MLKCEKTFKSKTKTNLESIIEETAASDGYQQGAPAIIAEQQQIRAYLLQELSEADAERVELRLLSDPGFAEEFDIMVDSIVDQYLDHKLSPEERERAEQYFFKSESRREKLKFAAALKKRKADLLRQRRRDTPYL